jgi:hypothetical protein
VATLMCIWEELCSLEIGLFARTIGEMIRPGGDVGREYSRYDYFLLMFPPNQRNEMAVLTLAIMDELHVERSDERLSNSEERNVSEEINTVDIPVLWTSSKLKESTITTSKGRFSHRHYRREPSSTNYKKLPSLPKRLPSYTN